MKYNVVTAKTLKTDNNKEFKVGCDIAFNVFNKKTNHHDNYIGEITEITDTAIVITCIEINGHRANGEKLVKLSDIEPNSCSCVYYD